VPGGSDIAWPAPTVTGAAALQAGKGAGRPQFSADSAFGTSGKPSAGIVPTVPHVLLLVVWFRKRAAHVAVWSRFTEFAAMTPSSVLTLIGAFALMTPFARFTLNDPLSSVVEGALAAKLCRPRNT
jgi:hypothetical protein